MKDCNATVFKTTSEQKGTTIFRNVGKCSLNAQNKTYKDLNLCVTENTRCPALENAVDDNCRMTQVCQLRTATDSVSTDQKQFYYTDVHPFISHEGP